jgi:hypothetical protein
MRNIRLKTKSLLLFVPLVILFTVKSAAACSCAGPIPPCEAYKKTPAIFIALVTDIQPSRSPNTDPPIVHLSVEEAFKGITQSKITTYQGTASGDCSLVFEKGERYLFYAWYSEETKQFHTNFCTRTRPLNIAAEDLDYLRNLPASDQNSRLSGTAVRLDYFRGDSPSTPELLKGIKVTATGDDGQRFEAVTDHQGFYKIVGLPSGHYKVSAEVPAHLTI